MDQPVHRWLSKNYRFKVKCLEREAQLGLSPGMVCIVPLPKEILVRVIWSLQRLHPDAPGSPSPFLCDLHLACVVWPLMTPMGRGNLQSSLHPHNRVEWEAWLCCLIQGQTERQDLTLELSCRLYWGWDFAWKSTPLSTSSSSPASPVASRGSLLE